VRLLGALGDSDLAGLPPPAPPTQRLDEPAADLPPEQRLARAEQHLARVEQIVARARGLADGATRQRDVVKAQCARDKLARLEAALGSATAGLARLRPGGAPVEPHEAHRQLLALSILRREAEALDHEAAQCIGEELAFVGGTTVSAAVDPSLPSAGSDDWLDLPGPLPPAHRPSSTDAPVAEAAPPAPGTGARSDGHRARALIAALAAGANRVRVEGFARPGEADAAAASLARARAFAAQLVARGVAAERIESVGTGIVAERDAVRLVDLGPAGSGEGARGPLVPLGDPLGEAHFVSGGLLTLGDRQSAMVSIVSAPVEIEKVYLYDPTSPRGSIRFTFNAVRFNNPTRHALAAGPVTVYADGRFLGEGLTDPIPAGASSLIPYALDQTVVVDSKLATREEVVRLVTIRRGLATAETSRVRRTELLLTNRGHARARVLVRHRVAEGFELGTRHAGEERLGGAHLIPVVVGPDESLLLAIEERAPVTKTIDLRSDDGLKAIGILLRQQRPDGELGRRLAAIVQSHARAAEIEEQMDALADQVAVYRSHLRDLERQLVALAKVPQTTGLRRLLANQMRQAGDRLQQATLALASLRSGLTAARLDLESGLAGLALASG
jgi:hypothetical protein